MAIAAGGLVDVADFADTDWIPVVLASGITSFVGYTMSYRLKAGIVYLRGRVTGITAGVNVQITNDIGGALPAGFRPGIPTEDLGLIANGGDPNTEYGRIWINDTGHISVRIVSGTAAFISCYFVADA